MNLSIPKFNINTLQVTFKGNNNKTFISAPSFKSNTNSGDTFELSVGYINDTHGQTNNMMRILSGIKGDLRLSAGDNDIGDEKNKAIHLVTTQFLNIAGIRASALGNHELDTNQNDCVESINRFDGDMLTVNFEQIPLEEQKPEEIKKYGRADLKGHLKNSTIVEVKGEKIGLIGASPMEFKDRLTHPDYYTDCNTNNLNDTIVLIQKEIDKLKEQNINKIFLLSHIGYEGDKIVAQETEGIDVILSGHTHELLKGIKEGKNLFYSKSGEPVIITEAGKDGNYFGLLNVTFDKDGVLTRAQNNLAETRRYYKNMINQTVFDHFLGKPEIVGYIKQAPPPLENLAEENPHANFACDAMRVKTNSDIALWHNSGIRNYFHEGEINSSDIKDISPFLDVVVIADVSEKTIVNAFKSAIETTYSSKGHKPGLIAVSGLNYTVNPLKKTLTEMNFIDKEGKAHKIDINNPLEDKFYRVVTDEFLMSAGADYNVLSDKDKYVKKYPYDKDVLICEYIKDLKEPVTINQTGRIKFEYDN